MTQSLVLIWWHCTLFSASAWEVTDVQTKPFPWDGPTGNMVSLLQHLQSCLGYWVPSGAVSERAWQCFPGHPSPQWGTPTQGTWSWEGSSQLDSSWGMMGELRVRKTRFWWWSWQTWWEYPRGAGQLNLPASLCSEKCHRMGMARGAAAASPGHIQAGCVWEQRSGGLWDKAWQQELKKYQGNGTREAIPLLLTQTQPSLFLCLLMNQRKLPPEPFAFQLLQLCFVSLRFKYSD